jgi:hypothetical protein
LHAELFGGGSLDPGLIPFHASNTADLMTDLLAGADLHARLGLSREPSERLAS